MPDRFLWVLAFAAAMAAAQPSDTVAFVNNYPISAAELAIGMARRRAEVLQYFSQRKARTDSRNFWTTDAGGEVPADVLKKKALDDCVSNKIEQIFALQMKVVDDIRFSTLQKQRSQENPIRRKMAADGGVVYGPVEYDEDSYFRYIHSNMVIELKKRLSEQTAIPDSMLRARYQKDSLLYTRKPVCKVLFVRISAGIADSAAAESVRRQMQDARDCRNINPPRNSVRAPAISCDTIVLDDQLLDARARVGRMIAGKIQDQALSLPEGSVGRPFAADENTGIVKCLHKDAAQLIPFEQARNRVLDMIISERYDEHVASMRRSAQVRINQPAYDAVVVR
jgi:hypothetical protein